jgi:hypothetical protein
MPRIRIEGKTIDGWTNGKPESRPVVSPWTNGKPESRPVVSPWTNGKPESRPVVSPWTNKVYSNTHFTFWSIASVILYKPSTH